ncbi:hypothetical protein BKA56DRAFT_651841 [Ilyonectria sp. MPI-CAGE-AT-0026]|nr:hypothetical protein BKA56DRAFT_651841 [Ilyonectria sp. MPI-CAGE-AT-0026]
MYSSLVANLQIHDVQRPLWTLTKLVRTPCRCQACLGGLSRRKSPEKNSGRVDVTGKRVIKVRTVRCTPGASTKPYYGVPIRPCTALPGRTARNQRAVRVTQLTTNSTRRAKAGPFHCSRMRRRVGNRVLDPSAHLSANPQRWPCSCRPHHTRGGSPRASRAWCCAPEPPAPAPAWGTGEGGGISLCTDAADGQGTNTHSMTLRSNSTCYEYMSFELRTRHSVAWVGPGPTEGSIEDPLIISTTRAHKQRRQATRCGARWVGVARVHHRTCCGCASVQLRRSVNRILHCFPPPSSPDPK